MGLLLALSRFAPLTFLAHDLDAGTGPPAVGSSPFPGPILVSKSSGPFGQILDKGSPYDLFSLGNIGLGGGSAGKLWLLLLLAGAPMVWPALLREWQWRVCRFQWRSSFFGGTDLDGRRPSRHHLGTTARNARASNGTDATVRPRPRSDFALLSYEKNLRCRGRRGLS